MNTLHTYSALSVTYGKKMITALSIILIAWFIAIIIKKIIVRIAKKMPHKKMVFNVLGSFCKITILIIGFITALGTIGVNVSAIVASLGLSGFALSFALKDYLSNVLAGIMILIYQPYHIGNHIIVGSATGTVSEINLRYTVLDNNDKKILIPNASMLNSSITIHKSN